MAQVSRRAVSAMALASVFAAPDAFAGLLLSASCTPAGIAVPNPGSGTITCGQFDSDLGDLNGVTFRFTPSYKAGGNIVNYGENPISPVVTMTARFTYGGALPSPYVIDLSASQTLGPLARLQSGEYNLEDADAQDLVLTSALDTYQSSSPFTFAITIAGQASVVWTEGSRVFGGGGGGSSLAVTYDYTPRGQEVPEPATIALVGLGLAATAVPRKRRKRTGT